MTETPTANGCVRIWHQDIPEGVQIRAEDFDPRVHRRHGEPATPAPGAEAVAEPPADDDEG